VSGTIRIDNMDISDRNEKEIRGFRINSIGYIFQDFGLIDYLNVEDNILLPVYLSPGMSVNRSMKERVDYLLTRLNLGDKRSSFSRQLSQGEKQRVSIARAVLLKPRIIIGDEATGNLDAKTTEKIMELLLEAVAESGSTFIFITHNLLLMKYFKRVIDIIELNK
jgi:ABC-type lipoprotein export system ATPase subunit